LCRADAKSNLPSILQSDCSANLEWQKLERAYETINAGCLLSAQVKNIAMLFTEDNYKFDFCRSAYLGTSDKENFFDVYDAFTSFSNAIRLYDYTRSAQRRTPEVRENEEPKKPKHNTPYFADLVHPTYVTYNGNKGCNGGKRSRFYGHCQSSGQTTNR
jgi:hypothetical protein